MSGKKGGQEEADVLPDVKRLTCSVFATSLLDKAEAIRLLTEETANLSVYVLNTPVVFDYIAAQSLFILL